MRPEDVDAGANADSLPDHLNAALENATDDTTRFHLREALQLLETPD